MAHSGSASGGGSELPTSGVQAMADQASKPDEADIAAGVPRRWQPLKRFGRDERGVTVVEFAALATPFFMLMFAIIETALIFWTNQVLEESLSEASRSILTGRAVTLYNDAATRTGQFRDAVCTRAPTLLDCNKLTIDVRSYASFEAAKTGTSGSNPISGGALNTSGFGYNSQPQPGQIVVVRAVLEYRILLNQWNGALVNIGQGRRAILASSAFRTEPYTVQASSP